MSNAAVFVGVLPQLPVGSMTAFFLPLPDRFIKKRPSLRGFFLPVAASHPFVYRA